MLSGRDDRHGDGEYLREPAGCCAERKFGGCAEWRDEALFGAVRLGSRAEEGVEEKVCELC